MSKANIEVNLEMKSKETCVNTLVKISLDDADQDPVGAINLHQEAIKYIKRIALDKSKRNIENLSKNYCYSHDCGECVLSNGKECLLALTRSKIKEELSAFG